MNGINKPTIIIPEYDPRDTPKATIYTRQIVQLSESDKIYLELWREKARKKYKKHFNYKYLDKDDENALADPDPFAKWYIFRINI